MRRALLLASIAAASGALADDATCCFKNAAYSGVCEVAPAKDETCQSILDYLNTPNSVGKSYCGGTTIRGGWELVACASEPKAQAAVRSPKRGQGPGATPGVPAPRGSQ
ncbi:MAG TPA: hypothetical protein VFM88_02625 [Vicinamibacteria bacterium]|nr:hypothetical protein [Vicinamibacteria bacterium]